MDVGAEANVVGQVPAHVVRIVIDDDVVTVPKPAIGQSDVKRRDAPEESAKAKPIRPAAAETPDMPGPDSAFESPMLKGVIEVEMSIVLTCVVPDPLAVGMNVGGFGMAGLIRRAFRFLRSRCGSASRRRTLGRHIAAAYLRCTTASMLFAAALRIGGRHRYYRSR